MATLTLEASAVNSDPGDGDYRPTALSGYAPRPYEEAFLVGFNLGLDREDVNAPSHYSPSDARAFRSGWLAGSREWDRRIDEMFAERMADGRITDSDAWPMGCVS